MSVLSLLGGIRDWRPAPAPTLRTTQPGGLPVRTHTCPSPPDDRTTCPHTLASRVGGWVLAKQKSIHVLTSFGPPRTTRQTAPARPTYARPRGAHAELAHSMEMTSSQMPTQSTRCAPISQSTPECDSHRTVSHTLFHLPFSVDTL